MKKTVLCFSAILLALSLSACSNGVLQTEYDKIVSEKIMLQSEIETLKTELQSALEIVDKYTEVTSSDGDINSDIPNDEVEILLYEDANVKIFFKSADIDKVKFTVENLTSYPVTIQMRAISFDENQTAESFSMNTRISPNSTGNSTLNITKGYIDTSNLNKASGQFAIRVEDEKSSAYEPYFSDVKLK